MSSGILGIGTSGLLAFQRGLTVTGHNIANSATEGYSRQRVDLNTRPPQFAGNGYIGTGVEVGGVNRVLDQFVENQLRTATSSSAQYSLFHDYAKRVDSLLASPDSGLAPGLQRFFAAVQDVATDPTSLPARQVMIAEGESLSDRFGSLYQQLEDQRTLVNGQIETTVDEINSLAQALADLNQTIVGATGRAGGAPPNDLLDQRDRLVRELAERVNVTTVPQDDGALNVFVGNGQSLVVGSTASELVAAPLGEDPMQVGIGYAGTGGTVSDISRFMTGGRLGAMLDLRSSVLDTAQNALGLSAVGLAQRFNELHMQGQDLQGMPGGEFFKALEPQVLARSGNSATGVPAVEFADTAQLTTEDYRLRFNGADWELRRASNNQPVGDWASVGLAIDVSAITGAAAGDSFLVRPTRIAAQQFGTVIEDPRRIAAAALSGDAGSVGDNTNALALAGLQDERFLAGGTATLEGTYNTLIGEVGTRTRQAEIASQSQARLLDEARNMRDSISGVNLDEEAANLLRYQQAYQAAAQVIAVSSTLFDTLLMAVRR
jgi:flagellar hook-associated protein 1